MTPNGNGRILQPSFREPLFQRLYENGITTV
jgi:hypothetical protein